MRSLCIQADQLMSQSLSLLQAINELENSAHALTYMQNYPFSMDNDTRYELVLIEKQLCCLQERMQGVDRFVKDSAYAYAQIEKQLIQRANELGRSSKKQLEAVVHAGMKDVPFATRKAAQKSRKKLAVSEDKESLKTWKLTSMEGYVHPSYTHRKDWKLRSLIHQGISGSMQTGFHMVKLSGTNEMGNSKAQMAFSLGEASLSGEAHCLLFDQLHPEVAAEATISASAISSLIRLDWQNDFLRTQTSAKGEVGVVHASGKAVINKKELTLKGEVGAAAAHGEIQGVLELWGVKITLSAEGEAGAVGIGGTFSTSANSFELGGKISCLLGTGVNLRIDW